MEIVFSTWKLGKNEKHCDHVSIEKVLQIQSLPSPPLYSFLRFAFPIVNLLGPIMMEGVGSCHELATCNMVFIMCFS